MVEEQVPTVFSIFIDSFVSPLHSFKCIKIYLHIHIFIQLFQHHLLKCPFVLMSTGVVLGNSKLCVYWGLFMIFFSVPKMYLLNFECASHAFNCRIKVNFNIDLASSHYWFISGKYLIIIIFH